MADYLWIVLLRGALFCIAAALSAQGDDIDWDAKP